MHETERRALNEADAVNRSNELIDATYKKAKIDRKRVRTRYKKVFVNLHVMLVTKREIFNAVENRQEVKNVKVFLCSL